MRLNLLSRCVFSQDLLLTYINNKKKILHLQSYLSGVKMLDRFKAWYGGTESTVKHFNLEKKSIYLLFKACVYFRSHQGTRLGSSEIAANQLCVRQPRRAQGVTTVHSPLSHCSTRLQINSALQLGGQNGGMQADSAFRIVLCVLLFAATWLLGLLFLLWGKIFYFLSSLLCLSQTFLPLLSDIAPLPVFIALCS